MNNILKIIFFCFTVVSGSKCPEARKPHVTSCNIFYECINLPEGGYVWAPMKCPEGLMFQPSLRICVIPGDSWTCIETISSIEQSPVNMPDLIDQTKTSYQNLNENSDLNGVFNLANLYPITPYPLIETEKSTKPNKLPNSLELNKKVSTSLNVLDRKKMEKLPNFNRLIYYTNSERPLMQTVLISPIINASSNEFFIQFVRNYIINKTVNGKASKNRVTDSPMTHTTEVIETSGIEPEINDHSPPDNLTDDTNNVIAIRGNLGRKEYVTIEKYKSLSSHLRIEVIEVIPCTTGIRLPNATNCMKYYTCEPKTAEVHDFICPHNTAFNTQINLCDPQMYKSCRRKLESSESQRLISIESKEMKNSRETTPCDKPGKFADKSAEKFYYLCFTSGNSNGDLEFVRLSCPNSLTFCDKRKVCLSKYNCIDPE